jgi:glyoxylase-like metal-dependent hydrolase (beta-lactamase superfamily II)
MRLAKETRMSRTWLMAVAMILLASGRLSAQDAGAALDAAAKAIGGDLKTIQYSGSGANFSLGQSVRPDAPWPRVTVKSYTATIDYETPAMRQELTRLVGENEQRQVLVVSGNYAWNMAGDTATPAPAAVGDRLRQIWLTPHGFLRAARASGATVTPETSGGRKLTRIAFTAHGKYKMSGLVNDQNLVETVETWADNPVLGDMRIETSFSDYRDFGGIRFPARIVQSQGGFPTLDLTVSAVQPNAAAAVQVPANVQQAAAPAVKVEAQKLADGVWYIVGGSHHSVAVEFKDYVVVIEAPQNEERSTAVIAEVKKTIPGKPIGYVVNTHHHFDHAGGLRTYVAEGSTVVTHQMNRAFYERTFAAPKTISPDKLSQSKRAAAFETVTDRKVLTDGVRTLEILHLQGNAHNDGLIVAYLPREKILIEADAFTPTAPNAPLPATPSPFAINLYENIQRLKVEVVSIAPLHGRVVPLTDLAAAIGKAPSQ